jgi:hypothetical protein
VRNTIPSAKGFRRGDCVRLPGGQIGFVFGLRSSGRFDVRRLDGTVLRQSASYRTLRRLAGARTLRIETLHVKGEALPPPASAGGPRAGD